MLENNPNLTQARKTGKVGDLTSRLARLGLTIEETRRFYALTKPDQLKLLDEPRLIPKRILAIAELLPSDANLFYKYSPEARSRILFLARQRVHQPSQAGSFGGSCTGDSRPAGSRSFANRDRSKRGGSAGRRRPGSCSGRKPQGFDRFTRSRGIARTFRRSPHGRGYSPRRSRRSAVEGLPIGSLRLGWARLLGGRGRTRSILSTRRLLPCIANWRAISRLPDLRLF